MGIIGDIYNIGKDLLPFIKSRNGSIYLNRSEINWSDFNNRVCSKYWICGTSLRGVAENELFKKFINKGSIDIRIMLPKTTNGFVSYEQLLKYDESAHSVLVDSQVDAARNSYDNLSKQIGSLTANNLDNYLRRYGGDNVFKYNYI